MTQQQLVNALDKYASHAIKLENHDCMEGKKGTFRLGFLAKIIVTTDSYKKVKSS